jgi:hypothetical protein
MFHRPLLRTRGPWIAAAIALALFAPNVVWQATHGFPTVEFARNALAHKYKALSALELVREIALMAGPASALLALVGIVAPFLSRQLRPQRSLALVLAIVVAILATVKGSKSEYLGAAFPTAFALGAVACARLAKSRVSKIAMGAIFGPLAIAYAAVVLPFVLPILSEDRFVEYMRARGQKPETSEKKELGRLPQHYADMHGWPEHAAAVERALARLTQDERSHSLIFTATGGYGPAAAIEHFGQGKSFPPVACAHNNYWLWRYPDPSPTTFVVVGGADEDVRPRFDSLERVDTIECGDCMPYENHKPVWIGRGPRFRLDDVWESLKHYE